MTESKLSKIKYSPKGYCKGIAAIKKVDEAAKVSEDVALAWRKNQAIWQINRPATRYIPRCKFDVCAPNEVHQADLLFLPHDKLIRKTYQYTLTVVYVTSSYKEAEPIATKQAKEKKLFFASKGEAR